jgi:adenylate cyclase
MPLVFGALAAILIAVAAVMIWQLVLRPSASPREVASKEKMAFPLPDKPSIAVLPFANMSEDPKQEFLCDGITESIITALSKAPRLFVIARNSTFVYKGKPVKVKQVSEELGVRYVLEGSVQRSADHVRVTAQLIDALTGHHLWAERYDRDVKDIFALQDEITLKILMAAQVKLTEGEKAPSYGKYFRGKQGFECYLKIQEGIGYVRNMNIADNNLGRRIAEEVLAMCPEVPMAYVLMAWVHSNDYWLGSTKSRRESTEKGIEMAQKALALDDHSAEAHSLLSALYGQKRDYDKGIAEAERAMALNPGGAGPIYFYANTLVYVGRSKEAIPLYQQAFRLNPHGPPQWYHNFGHALWFAGRYEEAVPQFKKVIELVPNHNTAHAWLAITYIMLGREAEARAEAEEHMRINPKFSVDTFAKTRVYKEQSEIDNIANAMRKVGLK